MFEKEWLPEALAIGVSYWDFWQLNPRIMKVIASGHEKKMQMQDAQMWKMGGYIISALDATVCNAFLWRKKGEKAHRYLERPLLQAQTKRSVRETDIAVTEDEKKMQTKELFQKLQIMGANFNLNHKSGSGS